MKLETLVLGPLETNCYVVDSEGDCWVVDPGMWPRRLMKLLKSDGAAPTRIIVTHGHADHIAGVGRVKTAYPDARVCCPAGDADMLTSPEKNLSAIMLFGIVSPSAEELVEPGQVLACGESRWDVLDTSGHTPGGVSLYCRSEGVVITGDALFAGGIGRTDIPGADEAMLLENIRENLLMLPGDTVVLPGHGPRTTIAAERAQNPFLTHP